MILSNLNPGEDIVEVYRLLRVYYGDDQGLVSLISGELLMVAYGTSNVSQLSRLPSVTLSDAAAEELFGEEHSWNDVIPLLQENYDWDRKTLNYSQDGDS